MEYSVTWSSGGAAEQNLTELDIRTADPGKIPCGYFNSVFIFSGAVFLTRVTSAVTDSRLFGKEDFYFERTHVLQMFRTVYFDSITVCLQY